MKKFEAIKTDENGVTFYSQGALDAKLIIAVDDATKSANQTCQDCMVNYRKMRTDIQEPRKIVELRLEIQNLKKQLEESNRIINEQNMSIQQLKGNLKEEQEKVRAIFGDIERIFFQSATRPNWMEGSKSNYLDVKKKHLGE